MFKILNIIWITDGNCRNDECISVKQGIGFSGYIAAEILKEKFFFFGKSLLFLSHFHGYGIFKTKQENSLVCPCVHGWRQFQEYRARNTMTITLNTTPPVNQHWKWTWRVYIQPDHLYFFQFPKHSIFSLWRCKQIPGRTSKAGMAVNLRNGIPMPLIGCNNY